MSARRVVVAAAAALLLGIAAVFMGALSYERPGPSRTIRADGFELVGRHDLAGPERRFGALPTELVAQTEDVIVDARGYAYLSDKNQGLYVVRARPGRHTP